MHPDEQYSIAVEGTIARSSLSTREWWKATPVSMRTAVTPVERNKARLYAAVEALRELGVEVEVKIIEKKVTTL